MWVSQIWWHDLGFREPHGRRKEPIFRSLTCARMPSIITPIQNMQEKKSSLPLFIYLCVCSRPCPPSELWGCDLFFSPDWHELRVSPPDSSSLWLSAWRLWCCLSGLYLWWLFSYCSLWEDMRMVSLLFTPEWRDLCPSGLPPQIPSQLQFASVTWGGEFSVVLSQQSR